MQTFTQALIGHVISGAVDQEVAANAATNRHDFLVTLERALKTDTADKRAAEEAAKPPQDDMPELRIVSPAG
jgi:hypothetical protein